MLWLNAFPVRSGVLNTFSPQEIMLRWRMDAKKYCRVLPGSYYKVYDKPAPSNLMVSRTHEGIVLGLRGNLQGSVNFLPEHRTRAQKEVFHGIPMPESMKTKVNKIGKKDKQGREF